MLVSMKQSDKYGESVASHMEYCKQIVNQSTWSQLSSLKMKSVERIRYSPHGPSHVFEIIHKTALVFGFIQLLVWTCFVILQQCALVLQEKVSLFIVSLSENSISCRVINNKEVFDSCKLTRTLSVFCVHKHNVCKLQKKNLLTMMICFRNIKVITLSSTFSSYQPTTSYESDKKRY